MPKYTFVILNYNNFCDTHDCIQHILKLNFPPKVQFHIVVVDNNSPDKSGHQLLEKYSCAENVTILLNQKNDGFSKGNNLGYRYAKRIDSDVVIVMNNDVMIEDCDFLYNLQQVESRNLVQIIAPDIITCDDIHQNPIKSMPMPLGKALKNLFLYKTINMFLLIPFFNNKIANLDNIRHMKWISTHQQQWQESTMNFVPHGACVIFEKSWVEKEDIAFQELTFMYQEEDILALYCKMKSYQMKYVPNIQVRHKENATVRKLHKDLVSKNRFRYCMMARALQKYIRYRLTITIKQKKVI